MYLAWEINFIFCQGEGKAFFGKVRRGFVFASQNCGCHKGSNLPAGKGRDTKRKTSFLVCFVKRKLAEKTVRRFWEAKAGRKMLRIL
jgi:hypothetical protein